MHFNLYLSDEIKSISTEVNNYKIHEFSLIKNSQCHIDNSFTINFEKNHHKKSFGKSLIIGGDDGYLGSIILAGESALKTGSRYVEILTTEKHATEIQFHRPELICNKLGSLKKIDFTSYKCLSIGPGMSDKKWSTEISQLILENIANNSKFSLIGDAGFLRFLSDHPINYDNWILTPHPGEAAELLKITTKDLQNDRFLAAIKLKEKFGGTIILKGNKTLVVNGQNIYICSHGRHSMGTAGMGDCLVGVLTSFLLMSKKHFNYKEILYAVGLHSFAADSVSKEIGEIGVLAGDVILKMNKLINNPNNA